MVSINQRRSHKTGSVWNRYSPGCRVVIVVSVGVLLAGFSPTSVAQRSTEPKRTFPLIIGDSSMQPMNLMEQDFARLPGHCHTWSGDAEFSCFIEWDEWMLVKAFVRPGDVVMEFGARFGTTSCMLSRAVGPSGVVIAVEPDRSVHGHLLSNQQSHQCGFHALLGTVGPEPMAYAWKQGYGSSTLKASDVAPLANKTKANIEFLPHMELDQVESTIGRKVNVVLIDCEGCIATVQSAGVLDQVEMIILEEDGLATYADLAKYKAGWSAYESWYKELSRDFNCHWSINATNLDHMKHSVWLRKDSDRNYPTCSEYVAKHGLEDRKDFQCLQCPIVQ